MHMYTDAVLTGDGKEVRSSIACIRRYARVHRYGNIYRAHGEFVSQLMPPLIVFTKCRADGVGQDGGHSEEVYNQRLRAKRCNAQTHTNVVLSAKCIAAMPPRRCKPC